MSSVFLIETRGFRGVSGSDGLSCPPPAEKPDWLDPCSEASLARLLELDEGTNCREMVSKFLRTLDEKSRSLRGTIWRC